MTNAWIDWFHTFITHVNTNNIVMWVTLQNNAGWACFKTPILREILRTHNLLLAEHYAFFGSHTFSSNKLDVLEATVSHSSKESEIISLDAGLRSDGIPRSYFVVSDCFSPWKHDSEPVCRDKNHVQGQSRGMFHVLSDVDLVPSNVQFSHQEAFVYVFEDNEAVIKIIIKERSPTMRHVSTELLLIGCLIELIWTPKSKSNTSTPKTNSQTF